MKGVRYNAATAQFLLHHKWRQADNRTWFDPTNQRVHPTDVARQIQLWRLAPAHRVTEEGRSQHSYSACIDCPRGVREYDHCAECGRVRVLHDEGGTS